MQQRILDGLTNGRDGLRLPANLLPRHLRRFVEHMLRGFAIDEFLQGDPVGGVDTQFVAGFEFHAGQIAGPPQDQRLTPHLLFEPQPAVGHRFSQLQDGAVQVIAQRLDHRIGLVHENLSADLEISDGHAGIDIGIVFGAAHDNMRKAVAGNVEQHPDAIGGRRELGHHVADFFEFGFPLLIGGLRQHHRMTQLVEQLLTGIGFRKQRQALLNEFERVGTGLARRLFALGFRLLRGIRNTAVTH